MSSMDTMMPDDVDDGVDANADHDVMVLLTVEEVPLRVY